MPFFIPKILRLSNQRGRTFFWEQSQWVFCGWLSFLLCVVSTVLKYFSILSWLQRAISTLGHEHYVEGPCVICIVRYLEYLWCDDNYFYVNVLTLNLYIIVSLFRCLIFHLIIGLLISWSLAEKIPLHKWPQTQIFYICWLSLI